MVRRRLEPPGRLVQDCPLPFDYELRKPWAFDRLFLLLHGHGETGQKIFQRLEPLLPASAAVLAPNAPFPISEWIGDWKKRQTKLTFCWHFYEPATDTYLISPDTSLSHIEQGVRALGFEDTPKTLIGFSQGGYLAPYLGGRLKKVDHVIAMGCEFLPDEMPAEAAFRLDGIFGEEDHIVKADRVRETHRSALSNASTGTLISIPDLGHEVDERMAAKVAELLAI